MKHKGIRAFFRQFKLCKLCGSSIGKQTLSPFSFLCDDCFAEIEKSRYKTEMGASDTLKFSIEENGKKQTHSIAVHSLFSYEGEARKALLRYKMEGEEKLKLLFASYVNSFALQKYNKETTLFIPLPCSSKGFKIRGFDQCLEILKCTDLHFTDALVLLKKRGKQQKELSGKMRELASEGKYGLDENKLSLYISRKTYTDVVLFDDVLTTGSTLQNTAKVIYKKLKSGGENITLSALTLFKEELDF